MWHLSGDAPRTIALRLLCSVVVNTVCCTCYLVRVVWVVFWWVNLHKWVTVKLLLSIEWFPTLANCQSLWRNRLIKINSWHGTLHKRANHCQTASSSPGSALGNKAAAARKSTEAGVQKVWTLTMALSLFVVNRTCEHSGPGLVLQPFCATPPAQSSLRTQLYSHRRITYFNSSESQYFWLRGVRGVKRIIDF